MPQLLSLPAFSFKAPGVINVPTSLHIAKIGDNAQQLSLTPSIGNAYGGTNTQPMSGDDHTDNSTELAPNVGASSCSMPSLTLSALTGTSAAGIQNGIPNSNNTSGIQMPTRMAKFGKAVFGGGLDKADGVGVQTFIGTVLPSKELTPQEKAQFILDSGFVRQSAPKMEAATLRQYQPALAHVSSAATPCDQVATEKPVTQHGVALFVSILKKLVPAERAGFIANYAPQVVRAAALSGTLNFGVSNQATYLEAPMPSSLPFGGLESVQSCAGQVFPTIESATHDIAEFPQGLDLPLGINTAPKLRSAESLGTTGTGCSLEGLRMPLVGTQTRQEHGSVSSLPQY